MTSLIDIVTKHHVDGYVVFTRTEDDHWWNRYLHPSFQHCHILVRENGVIVGLDSSLSCSALRAYPDPGGSLLPLIDGIAVPVKRTINIKQPRIKSIIAPFTCVESVKSVLGIRDPLLLTPYQLYKHLTRK